MEEEVFSPEDTEKSSDNTNGKEQQKLDPIIEEGHETPISSGNVVELASIRNRRLGIDAQLVKNKDNLSDIETNSLILFTRGIRVDLVEGWLQNRTHLSDAIAIANQGVDLNLIGTSDKVQDFTGLVGASPNEIISRIPKDAMILPWKPDWGRIEVGMKFGWIDASGRGWEVRMHGPDPEAPVGTNAASGWVLRIQRGRKYMDATGAWYTENAITNPNSSKYDRSNANKTHIPIQAP